MCVVGQRVDGGVKLPDGGVYHYDAGPVYDSGIHLLPDGGIPCTGLACNIDPCPGVDGGTTLTGTVMDPSGQLPLYDVFVYVPNGTVQPFPQGVSCGPCGASVSGFPVAITLTDSHGNFTLNNVPTNPAGTIPLVLQIGKWRRVTAVTSPTACMSTPVPTSVTRMPTMHDNTGNDIPHIALSTGSLDQLECLFHKMSLDGEVSAGPGSGRINLYQTNPGNPGATSVNGSNMPNGTSLYDNLSTLEQYDVVMLPCEGSPNAKTPQEEKNMVDYTNDGGRMFATHYGYEWIGTNYGAQPFPTTADWSVEDSAAPMDGIGVTINTGFAKGQAFHDWLANLPIPGTGLTNNEFLVHQARYDVAKVNATAPSYVSPTSAWMFGNSNADWSSSPTYNWTPHLTFDTPFGLDAGIGEGSGPVQCGRVVYSDFHVSNPSGGDYPSECAAPTFSAQEAALVFMLFDLSACVNGGGTQPICAGVNGSCSQNSDCCAGLSCLTPVSLEPCNGASGCACLTAIQ